MPPTESEIEKGESLLEFLTIRARGSSDARLAIDAGAGFTVGIAALLWRGPGWHALATAGLCFLCYGAWGIADRELRERAVPSRARQWLGFARIMAASLGILALIAFVLFAFGIALGSVKS